MITDRDVCCALDVRGVTPRTMNAPTVHLHRRHSSWSITDMEITHRQSAPIATACFRKRSPPTASLSTSLKMFQPPDSVISPLRCMQKPVQCCPRVGPTRASGWVLCQKYSIFIEILLNGLCRLLNADQCIQLSGKYRINQSINDVDRRRLI